LFEDGSNTTDLVVRSSAILLKERTKNQKVRTDENIKMKIERKRGQSAQQSSSKEEL